MTIPSQISTTLSLRSVKLSSMMKRSRAPQRWTISSISARTFSGDRGRHFLPWIIHMLQNEHWWGHERLVSSDSDGRSPTP